VPIKIEMNDDSGNVKVEINHETKPREMTKKHFTKQTSESSSQQQTMTHTEQKERVEDTADNFVKGVGYMHGKSSPGNIRRVPIKIEKADNVNVCTKNNVEDFETKINNNNNYHRKSENASHLKNSLSDPDSTKLFKSDSRKESYNSTAKPPQGKLNVLNQRDISREPGEINQKIKTAQQESDKFGQLLGGKNEVDFDQIETQLEDAKSKLNAQMKEMQSRNSLAHKIEPRSRSVGSEHRNVGARPKNSHQRYAFRRERSMEDIDKDIETIWKELQELDKLPRSDDKDPEMSERTKQSAPPPLSEQELVIPSWRTSTPPASRKVSVPINVNKIVHKSSMPRPRPVSSSSPRTIWDPPATTENPSKSSISQYQAFSTPSTHFSFLPKADTKPGSITPTIVNVSTRTSRSAIKEKRSNIEPAESSRAHSNEKPERSKSMPRQNTEWPQCYNSFQKIQGQSVTGVKQKESTPLKSCLKSDSRSNSLARTSQTRSKSPSRRESPAKQNVNFKQETCQNKFDTENQASITEQTYEFIDVKINKDEVKKVICTQAEHKRIDDTKTLRNVPIVREFNKEKTRLANPFTTTTKNEPRSIPIDIMKEQENKSTHILVNSDNQSEEVNKREKKSEEEIKSVQIAVAAPLATEDACYACDACTQTVVRDKKDGCNVM